jgi:hypothetical protein
MLSMFILMLILALQTASTAPHLYCDAVNNAARAAGNDDAVLGHSGDVM